MTQEVFTHDTIKNHFQCLVGYHKTAWDNMDSSIKQKMLAVTTDEEFLEVFAEYRKSTERQTNLATYDTVHKLVTTATSLAADHNYEHWPVLERATTSPRHWWNNEVTQRRLEIGSIALHFNKITANYPWDIDKSFDELTRKQQTIISFCFKQRNEPFNIIDSVKTF